MAYKDGKISIYPDGSFVGYIPETVFLALLRKGLIEKYGDTWYIPENKRNQVNDLQVVAVV